MAFYTRGKKKIKNLPPASVVLLIHDLPCKMWNNMYSLDSKAAKEAIILKKKGCWFDVSIV